MTLEEAIEREDLNAEMNRQIVDACHTDESVYLEMEDFYRDREEYHRQLAEWLKALKEIWDSGDCNDCLHQKNCTIRPKLGQMVRYNCYQYERKVQDDNRMDT